MWITFPSGPDPATNPGPSQNGQTNINGTELNATSQTPNTRLPDPVIDPALLELPAVLPTPRQSVTPAPTVQHSMAPRPRARPKGKAATVGIRPAQAPLIIPGDEHAPTPSTKFDEDNIPAPFAAFPRVTDTSHRRSYVFLALSRPFHSILQHIHIVLPFSKYSTQSRLQRLHRFAEARPFVTLLYLDARIHPRIASAAFAVFVLHFISHLHPVTGSPFVFILHTNYYTQSSYKNTVEILCKKKNKKIML